MIDSRDINVKLRLKYSYSYDENVDGNLKKKKWDSRDKNGGKLLTFAIDLIVAFYSNVFIDFTK